LQLIGQNNPEINGKSFVKPNENNNAIEINSDFITVKSITISDFLFGKNSALPGNGGVAVFCPERTKIELENMTIENCSYGIVFFATQSSEISNCKIAGMKKSGTEELSAGVGIMIWTKGEYLQANEIGVNKPNTISNCEGFGLLIGGKDTSAFIDLSLIKNNHFVGNGAGIGLLASTGIMTIEKNIFDENTVGIKMLGAALDTYITGNTFQSSKPTVAIQAEAKIDGVLLAEIWLKNENIFPRTSCAVMKGREIADTKGSRYIFSSPQSGKQILGEGQTLVNFVDLKK
jgi:parallel beta-helix repeat protein